MAFALLSGSRRQSRRTARRAPQRKAAFGLRSPQIEALQAESHPHISAASKTPFLQPKLKIGAPNDKFEQEADRVADEVMRMPEYRIVKGAGITGSASPTGIQRACRECEKEASTRPKVIQRMCSSCEEELHGQPMEEEEEEIIQPNEVSGRTPEVTPDVQAEINRLRGSGQPLPKSLRAFFEPRFGYDFGRVMVHTGARAENLARAVSARAFTLGNDIVFGHGEFRPRSSSGQRLVAHELTHVVQQRDLQGLATEAATHRVRRVPAGVDGPAACEAAEFPPAAVWFTDRMLTHIRTNEALMVFGATGRPVVLVQQALVAWSCDEGLGNVLPQFGADGIFGGETRAAVKTFQKDRGLVDDGIIGPITMGALDGFAPAPAGVLTCPSGTEPVPVASESLVETSRSVCVQSEKPPALANECDTPAGSPELIASGTWALFGHLARCVKQGCTLGVLAKALTGSGDNFECIRICLMRSPQAASAGRDYERFVLPGDLFDVSNLLADAGETSSLRIHLLDAEKQPQHVQWALHFYPALAVDASILPEDDIAQTSEEGATPIKEFLIFGHSSGEVMFGSFGPSGSGRFKPTDDTPDTPTRSFDRAREGKFPRRCWLSIDVFARSVGCKSNEWGKAFASTYLRKGQNAQVITTNASVRPHCTPDLRVPVTDLGFRCSSFNLIEFATTFEPRPAGTVLGGPFVSTKDFEGAKEHWEFIHGKL